jgi:phosphomannomutase
VATNDYKTQTRTEGKKTLPLSLPSSNVISYELEGGSRVTVRPSGTEPKIKYYFEVRESFSQQESVDEARKRAEARMATCREAFISLAKERGQN